MTFVEVLDWAIGLFPRFISYLSSMVITDGVSVLSFIIAMMIILLLIYAFIPRP